MKDLLVNGFKENEGKIGKTTSVHQRQWPATQSEVGQLKSLGNPVPITASPTKRKGGGDRINLRVMWNRLHHVIVWKIGKMQCV